ncbi:MAG: hypothetical protein ATN34_01495 [Epulopiscium sp. Nele67-Bin002]|nr:MAG: hypothetical protein BEN18_00145 [Epulopiscium sp. Nuni2H_MBin001]OON91650.1 MAG: hypothetical protein ATN34_01495 [Epulopiscium sp. Nele67-Bin002]OON92670.1 MAG: hypothetical protein ATN33_06810 [Epulopiscium sp. Nele67-Bin001]
MRINMYPVGEIEELCYLAIDENTNEAVLVDPGTEAKRLLKAIDDEGVSLKAILITHGHYDHIGGVMEIRKATGAKVIAHVEGKNYLPNPAYNLSGYRPVSTIQFDADEYVEEGELHINDGELQFEVIHIPGHTSDGVAFYSANAKVIFVGDILFKNGVGRSDLPGGNHISLIEGIKHKLLSLPDDVAVLPGHGPTTSIGLEKRTNMYLR